MVEPFEKGSKFTSGNICCFGFSHVGVPMATLIAYTCPSLNVAVVDLDPKRITSWNTKQTPCRDTQMEEMLKIAQNRNLIFTEKSDYSIKTADIILLSIDTSNREYGNKKLLDLTDVEEALRLIAKNVDNSSKVIALKSTVPVGSYEALRRILLANKPNIDSQLLVVPDFLSEDTVLKSLRHPDKILIGSDLSEEAIKATETLESLYRCWIPPEKIKRMNSSTVELTKFAESAFLAQRQTSVSALSVLCEHSGGDVFELMRLLKMYSDVNLCFEMGLGGTCLKRDVTYLVEMCEKLNLPEAADYWRQILLMNEFFERSFMKKILSFFFNSLLRKKIAVWGLSFMKSVETSNDALAIDFLKSLAQEGVTLNLCDPTMESRQVLSELKGAGVEDEQVTFCEDPCKAARKVDAILVLTDWPELRTLDYNHIYKEMMSPAHIFDGRSCLPHDELVKIGFLVHTMGKCSTGPSEYF